MNDPHWTPAYVWFELRDTRQVIPKSDKRRRLGLEFQLKPGETFARCPRQRHCVRFAAEGAARANTVTICGIWALRTALPSSPQLRLHPAKGARFPRCPRCSIMVRDWKRHGGAPLETELRSVAPAVTWSEICLLSPLALRLLNGAAPLLGYETAWDVPIELYPDLMSEGIVAAEAMRI